MEMFPDAEPAHVRKLIRTNAGNTVATVSETLASSEYPKRMQYQPLSEGELFQSPGYIASVKAQLLNEFPYHYKSSILAIMAECNNDYAQARLILADTPPGTIWTSIFSFMRRRMVALEEPDERLYRQLQEISQQKQMPIDKQLALQLNHNEYELLSQLIECQCCFGDYTFEELAQCSLGHLFCKSCVERALSEGIYGQGNLRGKPFKCMSSMDQCPGEFLDETIENSVPPPLYRNYQCTIDQKILTEAGLASAQCPFCQQVDIIPVTETRLIDKIKEYPLKKGIFAFCIMASLATVRWLIIYYGILTWTLVRRVWELNPRLKPKWVSKYSAKFDSLLQPSNPHPARLDCRNPECQTPSCAECQQPWKPLHDCYEQEKDSLRLCIESAMSQALIRTCPNCQIRFSKADGCNKMVCTNCAYSMCYICRQDIGQQGYKHFCQHFRLIPGKCDQCQKCDLYIVETDDKAAKKAAERAKIEWERRNARLRLDQIGPKY